MSHVRRVHEHIERLGQHHRKLHQEALQGALPASDGQTPVEPPAVPLTGIVGGDEGFWEIGAEE